MKFIPSAIILVQFLQPLMAANVELESCNSTTSSDICYASKEYHSNTPSPSPISVNATVDIREVVDISESKQTLTLLINFEVMWSDTRISKTNISNHAPIDISDHIRNLWIPEMYFSNSVRIEKFKG